jgi:hypothetical protein
MIEETGRITIDDLKIWGFLSKTPGEIGGTITFSRNGEKTGSIGAIVEIVEKPWHSYIQFNYLLDKKPVEYFHVIELFPLHFGGHRYYFKCRYCNRRVTALYLKGGYYACRHCQRLTYEARQRHRAPFEIMGRAFRFEHRAEELRKRGHPRKANRLFMRSYQLFQLGGAELQARAELEDRKGRRG